MKIYTLILIYKNLVINTDVKNSLPWVKVFILTFIIIYKT